MVHPSRASVGELRRSGLGIHARGVAPHGIAHATHGRVAPHGIGHRSSSSRRSGHGPGGRSRGAHGSHGSSGVVHRVVLLSACYRSGSGAREEKSCWKAHRCLLVKRCGGSARRSDPRSWRRQLTCHGSRLGLGECAQSAYHPLHKARRGEDRPRPRSTKGLEQELELTDEADLRAQLVAELVADPLLGQRNKLADVTRGRATQIHHDVGVDVRYLRCAYPVALET